MSEVATVCHVEIPAPDLEKAAAFYAQVLGWQVRRSSPGYWFFRAGDLEGAFSSRAKVAEGGILLVLRVEDVAAKLEEIAASGGSVLVRKAPLGDTPGFGASFRDPNGNRLGLWSEA